jgi:hypothetical protein
MQQLAEEFSLQVIMLLIGRKRAVLMEHGAA